MKEKELKEKVAFLEKELMSVKLAIFNKSIKTWEDIEMMVGNTKECVYTPSGQHIMCPTGKLHRHAIAEAKISQILAHGYYEVASEDEFGYALSVCGDPNEDNSSYNRTIVIKKTYFQYLNILRFKTRESAEEFLRYPENRELVKQYLMID